MGVVVHYKEVPEVLAKQIELYLPTVFEKVIFKYIRDREVPYREMDIDKACFELDYLIQKIKYADVLTKMTRGSKRIIEKPEDVRYITSGDVKQINKILKEYFTDEQDLRNTYEAEENNPDFPGRWEDDGFEYALGHYQSLKLFFEDLGSRNSAILLYQ